MLHDPRVRKLSFTGSTEVGRRLLREAADGVVSTAMELGGNAPFLVFDDADLDAAVARRDDRQDAQRGEACTAANRFYVQRGIAEEFTTRFAQQMAALRVGPGSTTASSWGRWSTPRAATRSSNSSTNASRRRARRSSPAARRPTGAGYFYPPTVLTDVPKGAAILAEEIFGPVAPIVVFDTDEEAIAQANQTEYGLVAYVYTADLGAGCGSARRSSPGWSG